MRISLEWLQDYLILDETISLDRICNALTMAGLEIESVEDVTHLSEQIFLGKIRSVKESNADNALYEIALGKDSVGALGPKDAAFEGQVVGFLKPKGQKKGHSIIADFSYLGFPQGVGEVIVFDERDLGLDIPKTLALVKGFSDKILTLGITPNRADALSHLGVARELCALLDLSPKSMMLSPKEMSGPTHERIAIEVENDDDCPRYACRIIESIVVKDSPTWMKKRLLASGIRPINNVVDVTNYVMLSRGQPMHAFDLNKLSGHDGRAKIIVRRAKEGEGLTTIDGKDIDLTADDLIIADPKGPIALAGVMGGCHSCVDDDTTTVVLEAAYFAPAQVRMSARRHSILTDSSYRFERGCDPNGVCDALNYAARLLSELSDGKVCRDVIDVYRKRIDPKEIMMRPDRAKAILGIADNDFDQDLIRKRFLALGIETSFKREDAIYYRVPTYRGDITREIDLIEEAARMIGYDKVSEGHVLGIHTKEFHDEKLQNATDTLCRTLAARGAFEAINYAFLNKDFQEKFLIKEDAKNCIDVKNPLSDRYSTMRMTLVPGLINNLLHNQRAQEKVVSLFEKGTVFLGRRDSGTKPNPNALSGTLDQDSYSIEKLMLAGVMTGPFPYEAFDVAAKNIDFYHVKGILCEALNALGFSFEYPDSNICFESRAEVPYLHPGESSTIIYKGCDDDAIKPLGWFGKLHPNLKDSLQVVGEVFLFELDLPSISSVSSIIPAFRPFSRFPTIERDVAFVVDESVEVGKILSVIEEVKEAQGTIKRMRVFDVYRGKNLGDNKKSIAISLVMQRNDRTLTDGDADDLLAKYIALVEKTANAKVR